MRTRLAVGCALVLAAAAPGFAQDWFEPDPSLARLSTDDAYARRSARSLSTAGIAEAVAIRLDDAGRVLVAGLGDSSGPRVARLDADGRLDATFGAAGVAELPVDAAGRIVVTGFFGEAGTDPWTPGYTGPVFGAARLLPDGSLDPAFSGDGLLELDRATGVHFLGPVRASGGDGAMLALAEQPSSKSWRRPLAGLVRISADGTIDATYGGGFAPIAEGRVTDFAVDSVGRAVFAVQIPDGFWPHAIVQRLDDAGGLDRSFWTIGLPWYVGDTALPISFAASALALDEAGRIVGLDGTRLLRRLPDGASDPAFAGDGYASIRATGFPPDVIALSLGFRDSAELYRFSTRFCAIARADPGYGGDPLCDADGFLAVATRADRWAFAKPVEYRNAKGRVVARGVGVQSIDPARPGSIVSTTYRFPGGSLGRVAGLAIAPDGTAAYALGDAFVLRVDLANPKPAPLPDLRAQWVGYPRAIDLGGGRYRVTARLRIRNASRRDAEAAYGFVRFGKYDIPLEANGEYSHPFRVRGRSSLVKRFTWEGGDTATNLAGVGLSIEIVCELPDANSSDNTATSLPMTPRYAPR
jgi:hypothetical protein